MKSKTGILVSSVSHDEVKLAMERFLKHGGKITKVKDTTQEILLKQDMGEEDMDYIMSDSGFLDSQSAKDYPSKHSLSKPIGYPQPDSRSGDSYWRLRKI